MKKDEFIQLAKDVSKCHICENMTTHPHLSNSEYLENDTHGLNTDTPYINRWNLWQGNLDADIMVIGQDYGQLDDGSNYDLWKSGTYTNFTDVSLKKLFDKAFSINIDATDSPLFFTNMANCYRKQKTTGEMHSGWLPICSNKYMARLIKIIRPKIIIVLGRATFEALHCMEDLSVKCSDICITGKATYAEIIKHQYHILLDNFTIKVFPVYHPGANSQINRNFDEQLKDWKNIAEYYEQIKSNN